MSSLYNKDTFLRYKHSLGGKLINKTMYPQITKMKDFVLTLFFFIVIRPSKRVIWFFICQNSIMFWKISFSTLYYLAPDDVERYDTTIAIPTNLKDGFYSLQVSMLVGNVYNSCGKLKVTGGNQDFSCQSSKEPVTNECVKASGPPFSKIQSGLLIFESKIFTFLF